MLGIQLPFIERGIAPGEVITDGLRSATWRTSHATLVQIWIDLKSELRSIAVRLDRELIRRIARGTSRARSLPENGDLLRDRRLQLLGGQDHAVEQKG